MGFPRPPVEQPMASVSFLAVREGLRGPWLFEEGVGRGMESQEVGTRESRLGSTAQAIRTQSPELQFLSRPHTWPRTSHVTSPTFRFLLTSRGKPMPPLHVAGQTSNTVPDT